MSTTRGLLRLQRLSSLRTLSARTTTAAGNQTRATCVCVVSRRGISFSSTARFPSHEDSHQQPRHNDGKEAFKDTHGQTADDSAALTSHTTASESDHLSQRPSPAHRLALASCKSLDELQAITLSFIATKPQHGHVAFINAALDQISKLNEPVETELYNKLLRVFPTNNTFRTQTLMDAIWPRETLQTDAALRVLEHMEEEGVIPSKETYDLCLEIFGRASQPLKKVRRMRYWMHMMLDANPFAPPLDLPDTAKGLHSLLLERIGNGNATDISELLPPAEEAQKERFLLCQHTDRQLDLVRHLSSIATTNTLLGITGPSYTWYCRRKRYFLVLMGKLHNKDTIVDLVLGTCTFDAETSPEMAADLWMRHLGETVSEFQDARCYVRVGTREQATPTSFCETLPSQNEDGNQDIEEGVLDSEPARHAGSRQ